MAFLDEAKSLSTSEGLFQRGGGRSKFEKNQAQWGWLFISPWIIGFLVFYLFPVLASLAFSFTDFDPRAVGDTQWVGLENWKALGSDSDLRDALRTTLVFIAIALPISVIFPILIAALLNVKQLVGKRLFTTLFYIPFMVPAVAALVVWRGFLNTKTGWLNRIIEWSGGNGPGWLSDPKWVVWGLIMIGLWGVGNAMLITLAGMQGVPSDLYEAGRIDGAGPFRLFWSITIPMITPVIFYNLILAVVGLFRYFDIPYILSRGTGDPDKAMWFFNMHFYNESFVLFDFGYGAALAWLLFFIAFAVTAVIFVTSKWWVYSPGGD